MTAPPEPAPEPLTEPEVRDWDETPTEAARFDRMHWNRDED